MLKIVNMPSYRTYIQQLKFNGIEYTKGDAVDILEEYNVVCEDFPFMLYPKSKQLPALDWPGRDGQDVYTPDKLPLDDYDIDVEFLCNGTEESVRADIVSFCKFLTGRNDGAIGCRLAVYNEYTGIGRKDVVVSEISNDLFFISENDPDAVAKFKVKFHVYDPSTDVTPVYETVGGVKKISQLNFE